MRTHKTKSTVPTLRDLALDHLAAIAADLRRHNPSLSKEQSVAKAAATPEGREAHRLYQTPGSELPWPQAVRAILEVSARTRTSSATANRPS
jgi:hypothetical protein